MSYSMTMVLNAQDNATPVLESFSSGVVSVSNQVTSQTKKMETNFKTLATGVSAVASTAYGLYLSYDRVQDMSLQVDKANLMVKTSTEAVEKAQAQLNLAVEKYGVDSPEAKQATDNLTIAQDRLAVANERASQTVENQQQAMTSFALMVVPQAITMLTGLGSVYTTLTGKKLADVLATKGHTASTATNTVALGAETTAKGIAATVTGVLTGAVHALNAAMKANPILFVVSLIALLVGALIVAYETCEPFRNAVDAIGKALYDFFAPALKVVSDALTWLWNNVLVPIGDTFKWLWGIIMDNPVIAFLLGPITAIAYVITHWQEVTEALGRAWEAVLNGMRWVWDNTIGPIVGALQTVWSVIAGGIPTGIAPGGAGETTENIGTFAHGGIIHRTGLAWVHKGEKVLPEGISPVTVPIVNQQVNQDILVQVSRSVSGFEVLNALFSMLPRFQQGGIMPYTGLAILEKGERVIPHNAIPSGATTHNYKVDASQTINFNSPLVVMTGGTNMGDTRTMGEVARRVVFDALRSVRIQATSSGALTSKVATYSTSITTTPSASAGSAGMVGSSAPVTTSAPTTISPVASPSSASSMTGSSSYNFTTNPMPYNRIMPLPY